MAIAVETTKRNTKSSEVRPRLAHESLHGIAQTVRFGVSGFLSNVIFLGVYNFLVETFAIFPASRIYAVWYCCYIPIGHALNALLVFGWPDPYLPSLLSNAPIGLTAMTVGTLMTEYLDRIHFDAYVAPLASNLPFMPPPPTNEEEPGEFYSSLVVMAVTGIFSYTASVYVNSGPSSKKGGAKGDKKEL